LHEVAAAPDIVTPIAIAFDDRGQLLVIESHTHQRPDDYEGPEHDRIRRMIDRDGDGRAEGFDTFFEGTAQTMSLARGPDGWMYVATRREILRLRDSDQDGRADEQESLIRLITPGDYPHNGLSGLVFAPDGRLVFGLGENLGEPYELVAASGQRCAGEGEGGNVFVCQSDGQDLQRLATGFWNPFGNGFDTMGRLFTVDNDPDASPPCRLLHVVPTGDYGYQFRYGRSGRHPLQAWDAELPATLPMAAGTGEAPCQVVPYRGRLWVTSWGDFRLEAYTLHTRGATCQATQEVIVQGGPRFRPVGLAIAPDGSLYFSDWVDRSYPVHGQGRLWRLTPPADRAADAAFPELSAAERRADRLRHEADRETLLAAATDDDPYIRQAAIAGLARTNEILKMDLTLLEHPRHRVAALSALRWRAPPQIAAWLDTMLRDPDDEVCLMSLRVIAEQRKRDRRGSIERLLEQRQPLTTRVGAAALATLSWLDHGAESKDLSTLHAQLAKYLNRDDSPPSLRRLALRSLPSDHDALSPARLVELFRRDSMLRPEIIGILADCGKPGAGEFLAEIACSAECASALRADACAALAAYLPDQMATLQSLLDDADPAVQQEARRDLRPRTPAATAAPRSPDVAPDASTQGDPAAGRRVFFRSVGARCSSCHVYDGRGGAVGPELTTIYRRADRKWLRDAITDPNRDVAPRFVAVTVVTNDGRTFTGQLMPGPGDDAAETLVDTNGREITLSLHQIDQRHYHTQSIMPERLGEVLDADELADLIAFLLQAP
jgi:putative membrane-bound dehydrogenase-like protein